MGHWAVSMRKQIFSVNATYSTLPAGGARTPACHLPRKKPALQRPRGLVLLLLLAWALPLLAIVS